MNNKEYLLEVNSLLEKYDIKAWVFGGWAEELLGIAEPRDHRDVDLLFPAEDFALVDKFIVDNKEISEIKEKHFFHKRAFVYKEVMIELFLVQKDEGGYYTNFWGKNKYYWPGTVLTDDSKKLRLASREALISYRSDHKRLRRRDAA